MLKWITLAPLIGAIITGLFGKRLGEKIVSLVACGSVPVSYTHLTLPTSDLV